MNIFCQIIVWMTFPSHKAVKKNKFLSIWASGLAAYLAVSVAHRMQGNKPVDTSKEHCIVGKEICPRWGLFSVLTV